MKRISKAAFALRPKPKEILHELGLTGDVVTQLCRSGGLRLRKSGQDVVTDGRVRLHEGPIERLRRFRSSKNTLALIGNRKVLHGFRVAPTLEAP